MLQALTVINFKGESLRMELTNPASSGLCIYNIDGIGAADASINTSSMATRDGARFNSARIGTRNIVISLAMEEVPSVEENRHKTYKYFPVKKPVTLIFETDIRETKIEGYVEKNEPNVFSKQETCQISIICTDPYFKRTNSQITNLSDVNPLFEFPFSNEGDEPVLVMGEIKKTNVAVIDYIGDGDTGFNIDIQSAGELRNLSIFNSETRAKLTLQDSVISKITGSTIVKNDIIHISTVKGAKSVILQRGTKTYNVINCLSRDSQWLELTQGRNRIGYSASQGLDGIYFKITNDVLYEGV